MSGLVHIYCGDGKGKTTAAMGLAVRCAGWQKRVLVAQLMKQDNSGERRILEQLPQVTLWQTYPSAKFSFRMTDAEKQAVLEQCHQVHSKQEMQMLVARLEENGAQG